MLAFTTSGLMHTSAMSSPRCKPTESTIEEDCPILPTPVAGDSIVNTSPIFSSPCEPIQSTWEEDWPLLPAPVANDSIADTSSAFGSRSQPTHSKRPLSSPAPAPTRSLSGLEELNIHTPGGSEDVIIQSLLEDSQAPEQSRKRAFRYTLEPFPWCIMPSEALKPITVIRPFRRVKEREDQIKRHRQWREERWREESIRLDRKSKELKTLFEFLNTLWGLLDTIIELMQTVRVYITLILNTVSSGFSEFPNSMRPPCTTMPWTIWPALVVLWGVCWMFYTPLSPADERQLQLSLLDAEWTLFPSSEALFDPLGAPFVTHQDISEHSALEDLNSVPNSFEWSNEIDFTYFSASRKSNRVNDILFEQVTPSCSLNQGSLLNFASSTDFLGAGNLVEQHPATALADNHFSMPSPTEGSAMALGVGASTQAEQTALPSQLSTTSTQPEQPPQNSDGEMICDHVDCNNKNLIFTNIRNWSKHKNKHERPYKCTINGCTRTQGFATKGDQIRHERIVHKTPNSRVSTQSSINTLLFCDEPNCARGPRPGNAGFNRRDNLMDHIRRRHERVLASSRVSMRGVGGVNGSTPLDNQRPALLQLEDQQMSSLVTVLGKERRTPTIQTPDMVDIEDTNPRKKPRQEDRDSNSDTERTLREEALTREVEKLRKELEKSQREKDVLIGVIDRLTQGPR